MKNMGDAPARCVESFGLLVYRTQLPAHARIRVCVFIHTSPDGKCVQCLCRVRVLEGLKRLHIMPLVVSEVYVLFSSSDAREQASLFVQALRRELAATSQENYSQQSRSRFTRVFVCGLSQLWVKFAMTETTS